VSALRRSSTRTLLNLAGISSGRLDDDEGVGLVLLERLGCCRFGEEEEDELLFVLVLRVRLLISLLELQFMLFSWCRWL